MKKSERLEEKAAQLRRQADALDIEAEAAKRAEKQQERANIETAAQRVVRGYDPLLIRDHMVRLRALTQEISSTDFDRACALDRLYNQLRVKAESLELAAIHKQVRREAYAARVNPHSEPIDEEALVKQRWSEHLASFRSDPD